MKKFLRNGYTTGACAAAGVKAALICLTAKKIVNSVEITALDGTKLTIPIKNVEKISDSEFRAEVIKFSGDDPDITNGASVFTTVRQIFSDEITFRAGIGVGHITKAGLQLKIGEPAINPAPRQLIRNVAAEFGFKNSLEVEISIPNGVELAKKTLNPVLGVEGGLSIIGTTGILRPMSEEAFKNSLVPQIDVAVAEGCDKLIFVPGKIGETIAKRLNLGGKIIQTSNFIGFMLESAAERDIKQIILCGHIGKLVKVASGIFHTHNRIADARLETLAAYSAAEGLNSAEIQKILDANTAEDAIQIINANNLQRVYKKIAERASFRAKRYIFGKIDVKTVLVDYAGNILGTDAIFIDIQNF